MTTRHLDGLLQTTEWQESTWDGRTATMDDWPEAPFESVTPPPPPSGRASCPDRAPNAG